MEGNSLAPKKTRIGYIDALKGLAILCVAVGHAANGYMNAGMYSETLFLNHLHNAIYTFHMPLLFIISGFVFNKSYFHSGGKGKSWIKVHVINYLFIYMLHSILTISTQIILSKYVNDVLSLRVIAWLPVKPYGVYWYFYTLSQLYLIFSVQCVHNLSYKYMLPLLLTISLIGTNWVPASIWFHFRSLCYYSFFFYLGILMAEKETHWIFSKKFVWAEFAIAIITCILHWSPNRTVDNIPTVNLIVGIGFSLFLFWLFHTFSIIGNCRVLRYMGRHSLEIYLFHTYFTSGFRQVDHFFNIDNVYISILLNMFVGILAPVLISAILKRLKLSTLFLQPVKLIKIKEQN